MSLEADDAFDKVLDRLVDTTKTLAQEREARDTGALRIRDLQQQVNDLERRCAIDVIPPARWDLGFLSRDGVDAIKKLPEVLDAPALLIGNPPGHDFQFACFCDGQHRITARQELGLPTFKAFVVSHEKERRFRIFDRVVR